LSGSRADFNYSFRAAGAMKCVGVNGGESKNLRIDYWHAIIDKSTLSHLASDLLPLMWRYIFHTLFSFFLNLNIPISLFRNDNVVQHPNTELEM